MKKSYTTGQRQPPHPLPSIFLCRRLFFAVVLPTKSTNRVSFLLLLYTNESTPTTTPFCPSLCTLFTHVSVFDPFLSEPLPRRILLRPLPLLISDQSNTWMSHSSHPILSCPPTFKPHSHSFAGSFAGKFLTQSARAEIKPAVVSGIVFSPPALAHVVDKHSLPIWLPCLSPIALAFSRTVEDRGTHSFTLPHTKTAERAEAN